ncbi:MAG: M16 family metallopeptidase, partial [Aquabacterium sp.]
PLALQQHTLRNGLRFIHVRTPGSATAAVQVWYRVGGKDDPAGRSGFAHLFEHMMFKRTRHLPNEAFDRLTEDVGGQNNAYTAEDVTVYQNEVPLHHTERLLWAEAERMSNLTVDQGNFDSERQVVIEELRQRVLADPYGRLWVALPGYTFERHPYRRPGIGSIEDLEAATLADVQRFHATYYRPDNAVLIVAADVEPAEALGWTQRYFGPLRRPAGAVPRVRITEPARQRDVRHAMTAPRVPLPALALLWKGPPAAHADSAALAVAGALLSAGESARLNEALVYRAEVAQAAGFQADLYADAGLIAGYAIAASGKALDDVERRLLAEIERLATKAIAADELDKVRARLLTSALSQRQRPAGQAAAVGNAVLVRGDARWADRELPELQAVTAADVQRVLRRWVLGARRATVTYQQEA